MCRNLVLAATALSLVLGAPGLALAKGKNKDKPAEAPAPAAAAASARTPAAQPAPAPARRATALERTEAERLDPLNRAAFWAREVEIDGRDVEAGVRLAAALRAIGRNEEAAQTAEAVLVIAPGDAGALLESARSHIAAGQGFHAIEPLRRVQAQDARDWRTWSLLGVALSQISRDDEAEAAWRQALLLSPDNPAVLSNLAMHQAAKGQVTQAETLLRKAAAQAGASVQVRQNLVLVLGLQGKLAEAEHLARQDLPPEVAANNLAYLHAAAGGGADLRSWRSVQGAQAAAN